jgi:post-segregation antitoxin (ccd killing protein)
MPKVSVYLPEELYAAARAEGLPVSALAQRAIEEALQQRDTRAWARRVRDRAPRVTRTLDTAAALDEARSEFGA